MAPPLDDSVIPDRQMLTMSLADMPAVPLKDTTANPAPLGLCAFGLTTVLLNFANAGFYPLDTMILGMGIFYGGLAQVLAGVMEWRKGNTFATTAFSSYGFFWLSFGGLVMLPKLGLGTAPGPEALAAYLGVWGVFTGIMFIGTLALTRALQAVFLSLTVLFFLLAIGDFTGSAVIKTIAGLEGILCGSLAIYTGMAQVLNDVYKKTVLPLG